MKRAVAFVAAFSMAFTMNGCGLFWLMGSSSSRAAPSEDTVEAATDTPSDQLFDLQIGDSVTISGVTVTVNSVVDGEAAAFGDTVGVNVTYLNQSGRSLSITPYDWSTLLTSGFDEAHVGGDSSFQVQTLTDGKSWTGVVSLWNPDDAEKIQFESSAINLRRDDKVSATWLLPQAPPSSTETTSVETTEQTETSVAVETTASEVPTTEPETTVPTEPTTEQQTDPTTEAPTEPQTAPPTDPVTDPPAATTAVQHTYVLNSNTMKFHKPTCSSVDEIALENRGEYTGTADEVIAMGYSPCGRCHPH